MRWLKCQVYMVRGCFDLQNLLASEKNIIPGNVCGGDECLRHRLQLIVLTLAIVITTSSSALHRPCGRRMYCFLRLHAMEQQLETPIRLLIIL